MSVLKFGFTTKQIIEEGRITQEQIDLLRSWLCTQVYPTLTEEQIVLFLLSCRNDQEATKTTIKEYYSITKAWPTVFKNRNLECQKLQKQLDVIEFCVLPKRSTDGCAIICARLQDTYYANVDLTYAVKLLFMTLEAALYDYPPNGFIILYDMAGVGLMHLTRARLGVVKLYFEYLQRALPGKLRQVHIFNTVYFIDKVMYIMKPFINDAVRKRMNFCPVNMDMESFYENWLPKSCLPEDYGGDLPSISTLHKKHIEKLTELQSNFEAEEAQRL